MSMPNHLVLVRHGESEGNIATNADAEGDTSLFTEEYITTPGHQWRLTNRGRAQAAVAGEWVTRAVAPSFDRYYVSPFVRTKETAGSLALPHARWQLNRALRERDWGDISALPQAEFESRAQYKENAWLRKNDPLYWMTPGGESVAHVAENRIRNVLSSLHRECSGQSVVCVSHGEAMGAFRLVLERLSDAEFKAMDEDKSQKIHNCEVFHYSRVDPDTGEVARRLTWVRRAHPVLKDGTWTMLEGPWREITFGSLSNEDLLEQVASVPILFPAHSA